MTDINRQMLNKIRSIVSEQKNIDLPKDDGYRVKPTVLKEVFARTKKNLNEEDNSKQPKGEPFVIKKNDVQFGSVRSSQEDAIRKTVGDVKFKDDSLKYYPEIQDLVVNGEIMGLGVTFQFRYKDPSGDGCYIWSDGLQLTDSNTRTIDKVRDAFLNWKQSLVEDGDLLDKLNKEATKNQ